MKLTTFFSVILCIQVSANAYSQRVTINMHDVSLKTVLSEIRKQVGYQIIGDLELIDSATPVSINVKNASLENALKQLLFRQGLDYELLGNIITIKKNNTRPAIRQSRPSVVLEVTQPTLEGKVTDEQNQPLAGATVQVVGIRLVVTTNNQGEFRLDNVPDGAVLRITFIGFEAKEIPVTDFKNAGVIALKKLTGVLDETIVQAYGTTSRRLNTGNIVKVSASEIERQPVGNPLATLDGLVPGMVVTQTTGLPGGAFNVEVRGRTAIDRNITDDQPLFIIDGVPYGPNNGWMGTTYSALGRPDATAVASQRGGVSPFNNLNPNDISSIEVLKDADATAIYGSRGANGVVLITTKKGSAGKTKLDFNTNFGFSSIANPVQWMDISQYRSIRKQAFENDGTTPTLTNAYDLLAWDTLRNTNFTDLLAGETARTYNNQLSLSGGSEQTQFLLSGTYRNEGSIMPGDFSDKKGGLHININHTAVNGKLTLLFSGNYNLEQNSLPSNDPLSGIQTAIPNLKVYEADGSLAWNEGGYRGLNPTAFLKQPYRGKTTTTYGNLQVNYRLTPSLKLKTSVGYNQNQLDERNLSPGIARNPASTMIRSTITSSTRYKSWIAEPQLEYDRSIAQGKLNALIGASWQQTDTYGTTINANGYSNDDLMESLAAATAFTARSISSQYRYQAVFGRINYNWHDRFLINVSARRDGSSRFGDGRQFANFGAAGVGWILSNERWFNTSSGGVSFAKLRGSYGVTGNDKIVNYQYLDTWMATATTYRGAGGLYPNKLFNPDYRWEKTDKLEGGAELGFLKDRILFSLSYYYNQSSNQLVNYRLPTMTGFGTVVANLPATVVNSGWEISISSTNISTPSFSWTSAFNITLPKGKLASFPNLAKSSYANTYVEGQSLNLIRAYKYTGVNPQTGLYTVEDVDNDGAMGTADRQVLGHLDPTAYGGFQNSMRYKAVTLDLFFSFRKQTGTGYQAYISQRPGNIGLNLPAAMSDFWTEPGQQATHQLLSMSSQAAQIAWANFQSSNGIYEDASFIRLKNVQISYHAPQKWLQKLSISQLRIFLQGQNLFTLSPYTIGDPEIQIFSRVPPLRVISTGVHFTL